MTVSPDRSAIDGYGQLTPTTMSSGRVPARGSGVRNDLAKGFAAHPLIYLVAREMKFRAALQSQVITNVLRRRSRSAVGLGLKLHADGFAPRRSRNGAVVLAAVLSHFGALAFARLFAVRPHRNEAARPLLESREACGHKCGDRHFTKARPHFVMYLLGVHNSAHDAAACLFRDYELVAAVSLERLTRQKGAGVSAEQEMPIPAIDECLDIASIGRADIDVACLTRDHWEYQSYALQGRLRLKQHLFRLLGQKRLPRMTYMMVKLGATDALDIFDVPLFKARYGFKKAEVYFANHHFAHGISAYFYSGFDESLVYTADACGDNVAYSARTARNGEFELLFGGDEKLHAVFPPHSLGNLYGHFTQALGFMMDRHEGKLTGLSACGEAKAAAEIKQHFRVEENGEISADFSDHEAMRKFAFEVASRLTREDAAASVQQVLEELVCEAVETLLRKTGLRDLAVAGGIFANVRLNRALIETTSAKRIFIFPAMGDEGLPVGACLDYLHQRDGAKAWQRQRRRLERVYLGRDYNGSFAAACTKYGKVVRDSTDHIGKAVAELAAGKIVAIYHGRMEYGPRALGNRSILASPLRREINDSISKRLNRSEFMPFAPVVLEQQAADVFDINDGNRHPARFMTITCSVRPQWRDSIAAIVHVDGSARPQIIGEDDNPLYFQVLSRFYERTGVPVLVNTSFNVHEEPIIDTPDQALRALLDGRVDSILTEDSLYSIG